MQWFYSQLWPQGVCEGASKQSPDATETFYKQLLQSRLSKGALCWARKLIHLSLPNLIHFYMFGYKID